MPAYKRSLEQPQCQEWGCTRKATFGVFNSANGMIGKFCGTHADKAVARLNEPASSIFRSK